MSKVTVVLYLTLDGVLENPAWTGPYFNDEVARLQHELLFASDALLLGRVTHEAMGGAWVGQTGEDGFADRINSLPKFVASRTRQSTGWNGQIIGPDAAAAVARLKQQPHHNLLVYGSGQLLQTLMQHNLIDEYRLLVHPLVLGSGQRLFASGSTATLKLVDTQTTSTGVLLLTYQPAHQ